MSSNVSRSRRVVAAFAAIAVTFFVHATWISDLQVADTRGPQAVA
jgi:hypothetical protein